MPHVIESTRAVYKSAGRSYLTKHGAYYNAAKALIKAKYPTELDYAPDDRLMTMLGLDMEGLDRRRERRGDLFNITEDDLGRTEFDTDAWIRLVKRVARFLEFVDSRRGGVL